MNIVIKAASRLVAGQLKGFALSPKPTANTATLFGKRWAHNAPVTYDFVRERILLVLRLFDKINPEKLTLDSHFYDDLGLDSLDHVEIILQLEDEFNFEIPDKDMEKMLRPSDILRYITDKEEAYEELQRLQAHHHHGDHGHGEDHSGHVSHDKKLSDGHNVTQKRNFSSWAQVSRRFASSSSDGKIPRYNTFETLPIEPPKIEDIQERVMKVCSKYDKIDSSQLSLTSHFVDDLGLDSLDHVEIMMELEDEFGMEIPDQDAEKLMRPAEIARYVFHKEEAKKPKPESRPY